MKNMEFTDIPLNCGKKENSLDFIEDELILDDDDTGSETASEQIIGAIGGFGKWQLRKCAFALLVIWYPGAFHLLNAVFLIGENDYWCKQPESFNLSRETWLAMSTPSLDDKCKVYDVDFSSFSSQEKLLDSWEYVDAVSNNKTKFCQEFEYDKTFWVRTIVQEWDLVCERYELQKLTQQFTFLGYLMGVTSSGIISDKYGRKIAMMSMLVLCIIFGFVCAFAPNYPVFLFGIWGAGFSSIGYGTIMFIWVMEILSGKVKTIFGSIPLINFSFWGLVLVAVAYYCPDWYYLELGFTLPCILLLATFWILPESPRWLLTHGRTEEAEQIILDIAIVNNRNLPMGFKLNPSDNRSEQSDDLGVMGFVHLFKTPNMRKKTLITYFMWFSIALVYYGLTLNTNYIGASLFTYFALGKVMEIPSVILVICLLLKAGRRISFMVLFFVCGICLISTIFIPEGYFTNEWPIMMMNIIGRGCGTGGLCLCYVYSAEIFPTVVRSVGMGTSSAWASIGSMVAPYIAELRVIEPTLPIVVFGSFALTTSILVSFLPETAHTKLPDTIEEGELHGQDDTFHRQISGIYCKKPSTYSLPDK